MSAGSFVGHGRPPNAAPAGGLFLALPFPGQRWGRRWRELVREHGEGRCLGRGERDERLDERQRGGQDGGQPVLCFSEGRAWEHHGVLPTRAAERCVLRQVCE